ncbi:hypothetical protein MKQ68_09255 [Chitinophaga horti]|uniref:Uncharacterized protein n=1 Tax=Chitinophaga horti TaxID=2920382 RepID=A0ABY6JAC2_9BACT|nr:hypothetical protein [Chitinophaga horti]UYQ95282.1 hypothetical protein MKQ68_09255 [Chitinophaga horti]
MLILAPTIRIPRAGELSHRADGQEALEKRAHAQIKEGFLVRMNASPLLPFRFEASININNDRLWQLFISLTEFLPDTVSCHYGMEDATSTLPMNKMEALAGLYPHKTALTEDAALSFGLVHNDKKAMYEITVSHTKYIRFYGREERAFVDKMNIFKLPEFKRLEFVDEYPYLVEKGKSDPKAVVKALDKVFGV